MRPTLSDAWRKRVEETPVPPDVVERDERWHMIEQALADEQAKQNDWGR